MERSQCQLIQATLWSILVQDQFGGEAYQRSETGLHHLLRTRAKSASVNLLRLPQNTPSWL